MIGRLAAMDFLSRAVEAVAEWREPVARSPSAAARSGALGRRVGGVHRADGGQPPVPPSALRGADAQAAASGGDRRLHGGDARQREQPRARRRAGDERHGARGDGVAGRDVRAARRSRSGTSRHRARSRTSRRCGSRANCIRARRSSTVPTRTTRTSACARCSGIESFAVPSDAHGRIDMDIVEKLCATGDIGMVVVTAGTTGTGTVDDIARAVALRERFGVRVHVDAAYGGFFTLLAREGLVSESFLAIAGADSVVVDPAQARAPAVRLRRGAVPRPRRGPAVQARLAVHLLHLGELHLGEISLECSRAGAAAAALWLTHARARPGADPGRRRARGARLGGPDRGVRRADAVPASRSWTSSRTSRRAGGRRRSTPRASACSTPG